MSKRNDVLLDVKDLKVHFRGKSKLPWKKPEILRAVDGVSFSVRKGTTFGLIGESGSGKSTTALSVLRLNPITAGSITLGETDVVASKGDGLRKLRSQMQMIYQDPYSSLNPRLRAESVIREPLDLMNVGTPQERETRVRELLKTVGLSSLQGALFPHQFSGGQRQRIGVARALATQPDLIVCDEPVSALDVAIQAQILNLLRRLQEKFGLTYLFISHDMGVVQYMCDEIAVMYLGVIVESAEREEFFRRPLHPYTKALLSAVPSTAARDERNDAYTGLGDDIPSQFEIFDRCPLCTRCPLVSDRCRNERPLLREASNGHKVACHNI